MKKQLEVTARIVNKKRHTLGYVINGSGVSRDEAVQLAHRNWLKGFKAASNGTVHLVGHNRSIYDLPIKIGF